MKLFLYEVKQQQLLAGVRSFLKVYSTISLGKLANYMDVDEPALRSQTSYAFSGLLLCKFSAVIYVFVGLCTVLNVTQDGLDDIQAQNTCCRF